MADVQLHGQKFEDMIFRRGRVVKWREAFVCPCWNLQSGQPAYTCAACQGSGYVYQAPVDCIALLQSVTFTKDFDEFTGSFEPGDAVLTVGESIPQLINGVPSATLRTTNPMFRIGMHDIIILTDDEWKASEILVRGVPIGKREPDTLLNNTVTQAIAAMVADPDSGLITQFSATPAVAVYAPLKSYTLGSFVSPSEPNGFAYKVTTAGTSASTPVVWPERSGASVTSGTAVFTEWSSPVDFTISSDGTVIWYSGHGPADNEQYSVIYMHRPVFTVLTELPTPRHQDKQNLPRRVALRHRSGGFSRVNP